MKGIFQCSKSERITNLQSRATHFPACYGKFTSQSVAIFLCFGFVEGEWSLDFVQGWITIRPPFGRICLTSSKHLKQIQLVWFTKLPKKKTHLRIFQVCISNLQVGWAKKSSDGHLDGLLRVPWIWWEREMTRTWRKKEKPGCFKVM